MEQHAMQIQRLKLTHARAPLDSQEHFATLVHGFVK